MRFILSILGILMILAGIVMFPLPVPLGLVFIMLGIITLVSSNQRAKRMLRWARKKWKWLDKFFDKSQEILPEDLAKPLKETDPAEPGDDDDGDSSEEDGANSHRKTLKRAAAHPRYRPPSRPR